METAPSKEDYFARIKIAVDAYNLDLLVQLWRQAPYVLSRFNALVSRAAIKRSLKELGTYYHIPVTQKTTFPELQFGDCSQERIARNPILNLWRCTTKRRLTSWLKLVMQKR